MKNTAKTSNTNWSDKAKALIYLVVAIELAILGYLGYDLYRDWTKNTETDATAVLISNSTPTTKDDCIMQFIEGKPFRICP